MLFRVVYVSGNHIDKKMFDNETFSVRERALKNAMKNFFWIDRQDYLIVDYLDENSIMFEYNKQCEYSKKIDASVTYKEITKEIKCIDGVNILFAVFSVSEIMKILYNFERNEPNELYSYNVRDVIEDSNVNKNIEESLKNKKEIFILLNNGITMIVSEKEKRGENGILLKYIRIVNGCQTCHSIINACKNNIENYQDVYVSVKIIEANDDKLLAQITHSSNSQNQVKSENLFALEPEMFELESEYKDFFIKYPNTIFYKVYLERRQGQYSNKKEEYIDILAQAKAMKSLWSKSPEDALKHAGECLDYFYKSIEKEYFKEKALLSGIYWNMILKLIPSEYNGARFHIFSCIVSYEIETKYSINIFSESEDAISRKLFEKNDDMIFLRKSKIDIKMEVESVCKAIESVITDKTKNGRIQYKKYYPKEVFKTIYTEYKKLKELGEK